MDFKRQGPLWVPKHEGIRRYLPQDITRWRKHLDWRKRQPRPTLTIVRVQVVAAFGGTGNYSATISSSGSGNFLVAIYSQYSTTTLPTVPTDNLSSTWSTAYNLAEATDGTTQSCFYLANCGAGITSVSFHQGSGTWSSAVVAEYSGVATSSTLDSAVGTLTYQTPVTSWTSNSITTANTCLLIGISHCHHGANEHFASSGAWATLQDSPHAGDGDDLYTQEQLNVAAGTYNAAGTGDSNTYVSGIAAFKAAAGGVTIPQLPLLGVGT